MCKVRAMCMYMWQVYIILIPLLCTIVWPYIHIRWTGNIYLLPAGPYLLIVMYVHLSANSLQTAAVLTFL